MTRWKAVGLYNERKPVSANGALGLAIVMLALCAAGCSGDKASEERSGGDQVSSSHHHDGGGATDTQSSDALPGGDVGSTDAGEVADAAQPPTLSPPPLHSPILFEPGQGAPTPRVQTVVALGGQDDLAVAWTGVNEDNSLGIRFALYGRDGSVKVPAYPLSTSTQGIQNEPSICQLAGGGYVVAWSRDTQSVGPDGENLEIRFRVVGADGQPAQDTDTRVLSGAPGNHWLAEVACDPSGGFAVAGVRPDTDGITFGAFVWRYKATGEPEGTAIALNIAPEGTQTYPDVAVNSDGSVVAVWSDDAEQEPGQPLDRVLLRWLPAGSSEPGEVVVMAGAPGSPATYGQVAAGDFDASARVAAVLSDGTLGLWSVTTAGVSTQLSVPSGGGAMTNPALAAVQPGTYVVAFHHGSGAAARLEIALLDSEGFVGGPTVVETEGQLPYPLSVDGGEGVVALGWTVKNGEGEYVPRVGVFKKP